MIRKQDIYGSDERRENMKVMEEPAKPRPHTKLTLEQRTRPLRRWWYHQADNRMSWIVGLAAAFFLIATVMAQLWLRWRP